MNNGNENEKEKENKKEHELIKWILIIIVVSIAIYLIFPKYHFNKDLTIRCNKITGKCEFRNLSSYPEIKWGWTKQGRTK